VARREGLELVERLRLVVVDEKVGRVVVGLRPPAGSDETRRLRRRNAYKRARRSKLPVAGM